MSRAVLNAISVTFVMGIYLRTNREYAGAVDCFLGGLILIPLIVRLEGVGITRGVVNIFDNARARE